jgi:hypothetical protein
MYVYTTPELIFYLLVVLAIAMISVTTQYRFAVAYRLMRIRER